MQKLFTTAAFSALSIEATSPETDIGSGASVTIVPAHAASAGSAKPEPSAAQPIPDIDAVRAVTDAETAKRKALAAKLQAARQAASKPSPAANAKAAKRRVSSKASKPTVKQTPAKPTNAAREAQQRAQADARRLARDCASRAVAAFYSGASRPFKAASDRFADLNPSNGKSATARQAGLFLALITYGAGNMRADGTFTRGSFNVPAKLVNPNAKPGDTVRAQPESGCLGNALGRAVDYVSGPRSGREQSASVFKLRVPVVLAEIQASFGDAARDSAKRMLADYGKRAAKAAAKAAA